jgi:hypothetical protein
MGPENPKTTSIDTPKAPTKRNQMTQLERNRENISEPIGNGSLAPGRPTEP